MVALTAAKPDEMYGISRIDDAKQNAHAWRVSLLRNGTKFVKNFPDKRFGGKDVAFSRAVAHRDHIVSKHPPISRKEFSNAKRRNNKSGITGVYKYNKPYTTKDGSVQENWYWEANWPTSEGQSECQSFSVRRFGDERAKQLAVQARKVGLEKVEGIFWVCNRASNQVA